ncbi:right-handed parallel beta-helix repeat-containing protein [bacterium]|nr:right-handed parallel beta-helix repeat-containing protein [bacterium]
MIYRGSMLRMSMLIACMALAWVSAGCKTLQPKGAVYYVSTTGNDSRDGLSPQSAWKTISHAAQTAKAGDKVLIEGGKYGNEQVKFANSGEPGKPIVFEGYRGVPLLDKGKRNRDYSNFGLHVLRQHDITIRNIDLTQYMFCVRLEYSRNITLENVDAFDCGWEKWMGTGIQVIGCSRCKLKNCTVTNAGGENFHLLYSDDNVLDGCKSIGTLKGEDPYATDYYMVISWSNRNLIKDCIADDKAASGKGNHGIGVKDTNNRSQAAEKHGHSTGNTFVNCKAYNFEEAIFCGWGAHHNTYVNCVGDCGIKENNFANGIMVRDGAHDNTFTNCKAVGGSDALCIYQNEMPNQTDMRDPQQGNAFIDCTFECKARNRNGKPEVGRCLFLRNAKDTTFRDCTFKNASSLFRFSKGFEDQEDNSGTKFINCKVSNVKTLLDTGTLPYPWACRRGAQANGYNGMAGVTFTNTKFVKNGFDAPKGAR